MLSLVSAFPSSRRGGLLRAVLAIVITLALGMTLAHAKDAPPVPGNTELERHVMAISEELRCLVCQNQTIADSHAELAIDLRNQVREKLEQGMSDKDVIDYMVQRYGDFVRYRPPFKPTTWLLWLGPLLLVLIGASVLLIQLRRRRAGADAPVPLSDVALARAASLLDDPSQSKDAK